MRELGLRYGQGLQLINILRDAGSDLGQGRGYLPADELRSVGLAPEEVPHEPARVAPILERWREKAAHGLAAGIEYSFAIRNRRIRFATVLPALIGARTLALLREVDEADVFDVTVKVPRSEVRRLMLAGALASPRSLRASFQRLGGSRVPSHNAL